MEPVHVHLRALLTAARRPAGPVVRDDGGVLWCRTGIPWPMFNGVIAKRRG